MECLFPIYSFLYDNDVVCCKLEKFAFKEIGGNWKITIFNEFVVFARVVSTRCALL